MDPLLELFGEEGERRDSLPPEVSLYKSSLALVMDVYNIYIYLYSSGRGREY